MTPDGPVFIYKAISNHEIQLVGQGPGRLIIIRFYPGKKHLRGQTEDNKIVL